MCGGVVRSDRVYRQQVEEIDRQLDAATIWSQVGPHIILPLVLWLSSVRVFLDQILLGGSTGDKDQQHRQERTPGA
ncbi:MAG TPA: hypothetical protein DIC52_04200 [Candidatus Latescibacteria bacterium]|nr:hypothetical protein [Candidatus Latescibacterota bacterium]